MEAESLGRVLTHVHTCACPSQQEKEPEIWKAIRFGTVLENVEYDPHTRVVDYDSKALTENTRACYPIEHIDNARIPCMAGHPKCVSWGLRGSSGAHTGAWGEGQTVWWWCGKRWSGGTVAKSWRWAAG